MTLVTLLIALSLDYFLGNMDRFRPLDWFDRYAARLETRFANRSWWDGKVGVLLTLTGPLLLVVLIGHAPNYLPLHPVFMYLFTLAVLIYSLGPDVNTLLSQYIAALVNEDQSARFAKSAKSELESVFMLAEQAEAEQAEVEHASVIEALFLRAHERLFAVIFWFIVLDAFGALLFCLTVRLLEKYRDIHGAYASAVRDLFNILSWPTARLMAVGLAVAGSLRDGMKGWVSATGDTLTASNDIIKHSGLGALQYSPDHGPDYAPNDAPNDEGDDDDPYVEWLHETQSLLNRTLIVWLAVLGFITIPGWLS